MCAKLIIDDHAHKNNAYFGIIDEFALKAKYITDHICFQNQESANSQVRCHDLCLFQSPQIYLKTQKFYGEFHVLAWVFLNTTTHFSMCVLFIDPMKDSMGAVKLSFSYFEVGSGS